jgi:hypothetical protein
LKLLLLSLGDVKLRPLPRHQQLVHGLRHQRRYNLLDSRLDVGRGGDGDPGRSELRLDLRLETVLFCVRGSIVGFFFFTRRGIPRSMERKANAWWEWRVVKPGEKSKQTFQYFVRCWVP